MKDTKTEKKKEVHEVIKESPESKIKHLIYNIKCEYIYAPLIKVRFSQVWFKRTKKLQAHVVYKRTINTKCYIKG